MRSNLQPGRYVVAVSGGVDSVVLLDLLANQPELALVVAHFDHGIRGNSAEDRKFVEKLAKKYGLSFIFAEGMLGPDASEASAREKRYEFLNRVREERDADAIVTAHHQDDVLETAIINLLRGTNRRGLSSLRETAGIKRPLLNYSKQQIKNYAEINGLKWRDDPTNTDKKYLRNYVRLELIPRLGPGGRERLIEIIKNAGQQNQLIDQALLELVSEGVDRDIFRSYDASLGLEVVAAWLRVNGVTGYDRKTLARLAAAIRTAKVGTVHNILGNKVLSIERDGLALKTLER